MRKIWILLDKDNIVRCIASEECNLHKDKFHLDRHYVDYGGRVGDEFDPKTEKWTARPENYPMESKVESDEKKIQQEMRKLAIESLKAKGEL